MPKWLVSVYVCGILHASTEVTGTITFAYEEVEDIKQEILNDIGFIEPSDIRTRVTSI